ncbi:hypothetical protein [Streptomyces sp. A30]|uniref:hypothetical protein n=1 Tax=Streptomyces sp. A30 TaxID=2789273 RepID=UPI00398144EF
MTVLTELPDEHTQIRGLRNEATIAQIALEQMTAAVQAGLHTEAGTDLLYRLGEENGFDGPTITSLLGELVGALTTHLQTSGQPGAAHAANHLTNAAASLTAVAEHVEHALGALTEHAG